MTVCETCMIKFLWLWYTHVDVEAAADVEAAPVSETAEPEAEEIAAAADVSEDDKAE